MTQAQTVVVRTLASIPKRSASETWTIIVQLVAPDKSSAARIELESVRGIACSIIADESPQDEPIVVHGAGPRLRLYTVYGEAAIEGDRTNEAVLSFVPTVGTWLMSLPCTPEDYDWVAEALAAKSWRITARAPGESVRDDSANEETSAPFQPDVDLDAFFRR